MKSMGSISSISSSLFSPISSTSAVNATTSTGDVSSPDIIDKEHLSPLAKLLSKLQNLQQSDPSKYKEVTTQIATKLNAAAQDAASSGDAAGAKHLEQLASDFTDASNSGQLPNVDDLAQAVHHGHGHHHGPPPPAQSSNSTSTESSDDSASQILNQLLKAYQDNSSRQGTSTDPLQLISDTLNKAGSSSSDISVS